MERGERQVSRLGNLQGGFNRLEIPHLANEHDVRILAEGGTQCVRKTVRIRVNFTLIDQTVLVRMDVLDRVLDRQNVVLTLGIDLVDHRGECRGLAAAGRAGDQHEAARALGQHGQHRRQPELAERPDLFRDEPVDCGNSAPLVEDVAPESCQAADTEREIELQGFFEALLLCIGENAVDQLLGLGRRQLRQLQPLQVPMHANLRRRIRGDV
jgi:hypothetical protein